MSVRILEDRESGQCALYCSTSGVAFGPIIENSEAADKFIREYLTLDARHYGQLELVNCYADFANENICECGGVRDEEDRGDKNERWKCESCIDKAVRP